MNRELSRSLVCNQILSIATFAIIEATKAFFVAFCQPHLNLLSSHVANGDNTDLYSQAMIILSEWLYINYDLENELTFKVAYCKYRRELDLIFQVEPVIDRALPLLLVRVSRRCVLGRPRRHGRPHPGQRSLVLPVEEVPVRKHEDQGQANQVWHISI